MSNKAGFVPKWTGEVTLVAGTVTIANLENITANDLVMVTQHVSAGTTGTHYESTAGAGEFTVSAVDTAGALVNTDTSTLHVAIFPSAYFPPGGGNYP